MCVEVHLYCKIRKNAYTLQNGQKRTDIIGKAIPRNVILKPASGKSCVTEKIFCMVLEVQAYGEKYFGAL